MRIRALECGAGRVVGIRVDLDRHFEQNPKRVGRSVATERRVVGGQQLSRARVNDLNGHVVVGRAVNRAVETEPDDEYASVNDEPNPIACPAITPTAFGSLETTYHLFFACYATTRDVWKGNRRLRVDSEVQK